jgi:putative holliday junction resolvase
LIEFIQKLSELLPDVEIVKLDERFTSSLAQKSILDSGVSRKKRREEKGWSMLLQPLFYYRII